MNSSETPINFDQSDPVPLDPLILSARDELLVKYADKSFEEQITFYKAVIEGEKDSLSRLSAMAARVYILRKRLALLAGNVMEDQLDELSNKQSGFDLDNTLAAVSDIKEPEVIGNNKSWMRLRIVDSSEVNGVRFPAGVVIDVKREDGEKLIESGKAEFMSTEESRQFKSEEGLEEEYHKVEADAVSEEGTAQEVEADAVSEEGTAQEVEADAVSEEGTAQEVEADAVSEEDTAEEVEVDAISEEDTAQEVEADAVSEEDTAGEVEADAVSEEDTAEEVKADAVSEEDTAQEVEADAVSEEGTAGEVETDAVSGKPVDLENNKV